MNIGEMKQESVAAVIVTYNRLDKLRVTLERALELPFTQIVVVDNASTDGTSEWLDAQKDVRLRIIHESENCGGAGGFARGFDYTVRCTDAEWLVCFDDDAYPEPDALKAFRALSLGHSVGAVAAAVYLPTGGISAMNRPGLNPFRSPRLLWSALFKRTGRFGIPDEAYDAEPREVCYCSFVGLFLRCALVREVIGLPRSELFIYGDDSIYTLDIVRRGYTLLFVPSVRFVHDCGINFEQSRVFEPMWKAYYAFRNGLTFYRDLSGHYFYPIIMPMLMMSWLGSSRYYVDRRLFWRVAIAAISDGFRKDFSRSHQEVLHLAANRRCGAGKSKISSLTPK